MRVCSRQDLRHRLIICDYGDEYCFGKNTDMKICDNGIITYIPVINSRAVICF